MANNPKMMDPTEAALSAIQEALNIHEEDEQPASPVAAAPDLFATPAESPTQIARALGVSRASVYRHLGGEAREA